MAHRWLTPSRRFELPLRGLDGEERWEYCDIILNELGLALKIHRNDPELKNLMDLLAGHPLAMQVVLPKLAYMQPAAVARALRSNIAELGLNEQEEQGRLFATLRFVEQGLPEQLRPLLQLIALHESHVDANLMEFMAQEISPSWNRSRIDQLMAALTAAGLTKDVGNAIYEMHPLLTSYLRSQIPASSEVERAFVDVMATASGKLSPRELHEQRMRFVIHGSNFGYALELAGNLSLDGQTAALTQSLAAYAQNSRDFSEAVRLFENLGRYAKRHEIYQLEAIAYHQLGMIAEEQRQFAAAREYYLKCLDIRKKRGDLPGAAKTYHQLGVTAAAQRDFATARDWNLKSLAIKEQQCDLSGAAATYHQLGRVAEE